MNKLKFPLLAAFSVGLLALGIGLDQYYMPHRDVRSAPVFDEFDVDDFTTEFLQDPEKSRDKYLAEDGDSKIVSMKGTISDIDTNLNNCIVIEIRGKRTECGARFTLLPDQNEQAGSYHVGDEIEITGVVSAGAEYDADFDLYFDAILEQAYFSEKSE